MQGNPTFERGKNDQSVSELEFQYKNMAVSKASSCVL